ncbi:hypothetical protein LEP1GSC150_0423 [Leptospira interrogans serovar Copenhageni str. LT2050]|uniref:Uncharacterized protein n=1 Tax=Leptospira interrogans serovar Copenhageni str. LT2050 TaxID=1001598 RepID=M3IRN6_LEPIT|nr:hypothetical protein LEP1GSC150_0423 [Leptospira interrogans serovar Copenhageni str. LT2050]
MRQLLSSFIRNKNLIYNFANGFLFPSFFTIKSDGVSKTG